MNADKTACASSGRTTHANQFDWFQCARPVNRLQVHIVKVTWEFLARTGFAHVGL
jgi:hypothetical protein